MIRNYWAICWRNLFRTKAYTAINISGLSVGLSSFIMITLFVQHELSFDRFFPNAGAVYNIYQKQSGNVFLGTDYFAVTPAQLASVLEAEFPEVEGSVSVFEQHGSLELGDQKYWERNLAAGPHFFQLFGFGFISGNPESALRDPKSIVLTASLAQKMFGATDPIGQSLRYEDKEGYTVTGVIHDPPANSSLQFAFVIPAEAVEWYAEEIKRPTWHNNSVHTFVRLREHTDVAALQKKFKPLLKKYQDPESYANYPFKDEYFLEPLADMHLRPGINSDIGVKGNQRYLYIFSGVALAVLILACVNYMSLAIAMSVRRAREVGMRKAVGALRRQLMAQFLGESVLIAFISLMLALLITSLLTPAFSRLVDRPIALDFFQNVWLLPGLLVLVMIVGLFSGSYPSFVLSSLRPIQVLTGKLSGKMPGLRLQRWLIVAQFAVSIVLIIGSMVIYRQLQYMKQKELGYTREHVVTIPMKDHGLMPKLTTLINEWQEQPAIIAATSSRHLPTNITSSVVLNDEDGSGKEDDLPIYEWHVNHDFTEVFSIQLITGRTFSRAVATDPKEAVLLNETAVKALGWTSHEAVGKRFIHDGPKTVVGVIRDFHMHSMHLAIEPLLVRLNPNRANFISVKIQPGKEAETLAVLESTLKKYSTYPFEYQFLDDHFNQLYSFEMKTGEVFGAFTTVSILIAALGLFGLAAFSASRRTKEIGIRKALGASAQNIVSLLMNDFLLLVLIAFVISTPLAWYVMHTWLLDFAYHVRIEWWIFAIAGVFALLVAVFAMIYQSIKASATNPAVTLRD